MVDGRWLVVALAVGLYLAVRWHTLSFAYRCRCGREFTISMGVNLVSPHWPTRRGGVKYLRCPECGRRSWAAVIPRTGRG